jgi:hypothetical protein
MNYGSLRNWLVIVVISTVAVSIFVFLGLIVFMKAVELLLENRFTPFDTRDDFIGFLR